MCRVLGFRGTCTRCKQHYVWNDLTQELFCLEAKNNGALGNCRHGVSSEYHEFDQECDDCALEEGGGSAGGGSSSRGGGRDKDSGGGDGDRHKRKKQRT